MGVRQSCTHPRLHDGLREVAVVGAEHGLAPARDALARRHRRRCSRLFVGSSLPGVRLEIGWWHGVRYYYIPAFINRAVSYCKITRVKSASEKKTRLKHVFEEARTSQQQHTCSFYTSKDTALTSSSTSPEPGPGPRRTNALKEAPRDEGLPPCSHVFALSLEVVKRLTQLR